jgi:hypothetical protein
MTQRGQRAIKVPPINTAPKTLEQPSRYGTYSAKTTPSVIHRGHAIARPPLRDR